MIDISILFLLLSSIIMFVFVVWQFIKHKTILPSGFGVIFLLVGYTIFPIIFLLGYVDVSSIYTQKAEEGYLHPYYLVSSILIFIFLFFLFIGYFVSQNQQYILTVNPGKKTNFFKFFILLFIISTFSFVVYLSLYGGFSYVIENISQIRSGKSENKNYFASFLGLFSNYYVFLLCALYSHILILKKRLVVSRSKLKFLIVFFAIFVFFVFLKKFMDGGRGGLVSVFIYIGLIHSLYLKKIDIKYIFIIIFFSFFVIVYGKSVLFQVLLYDEFSITSFDTSLNSIFCKILLDFSHLFMSIVNAIEKGLGADRLFCDFIYFLLKPLKLFGYEGIDSISYYNTFHIMGIWDSNIPPGMVAFLYIQGGILFIPVGAFFIGMFFSLVDKVVYNSTFVDNPFVLAFLPLIITESSRLFMGFDLALFFQSIFVYLVLFTYFILIGYIKIVKIKFYENYGK